jgi:ribosomal protein S12 methylthiotransferase accessory factor
MSSSGLASGNHPNEALSHALCELIERDAVTLHRFSSERVRGQTRVDLRTVDDPVCRALLDRYDQAGILVAVWEITSDIGVAAFACTIVDGDPNPNRPIGPMGGYGCHPSRAIALSRALTEAAQSRLTIITGSRDDVRHQGPAGPQADLDAAITVRRKLLAEAPARSYRDAPDFSGATLEEDVKCILERLLSAAIREAVAVDLTKPVFKIPVVRVIVPGLEPLCDVPGYVPGARARRRLAERAS